MLKFKNNINNLVNKINLDYINYRIHKEFCNNTIKQLEDINLLDKYKKTKSVQNKIKEIELMMKECDIESNKRELFINKYMLKLIPAGTKGDIRGKKFNNIVQNTINNLKLDNNRFEICFEEKCSLCITDEIPSPKGRLLRTRNTLPEGEAITHAKYLIGIFLKNPLIK
jgi:hypothetical protein